LSEQWHFEVLIKERKKCGVGKVKEKYSNLYLFYLIDNKYAKYQLRTFLIFLMSWTNNDIDYCDGHLTAIRRNCPINHILSNRRQKGPIRCPFQVWTISGVE